MKTSFTKKKASLFCFVLGLLFFANDQRAVAAIQTPATSIIEAKVTISASLGEPILRLWGYGPVNSRVELTGSGVSDFTFTSADGYFEFGRSYLPTTNAFFYPELCLTAIDGAGRITTPTCIPPLPTTQMSYDVGPVILPPTLSFEAGTVVVSSQTTAEGVTLPNSEVKIVLAEDGNRSKIAKLGLVKEAKAYYIPDYTVKSDSQGNFSFNMPNTTPNNWRVFAATTYSKGVLSPKSNTLVFKVVSPTLVLLENIWKFLLSLLTLPVLIFLEIFILLIIVLTIILTRKRKLKVLTNISKPVREYQEYLRSKHRSL